MSMKSDIIIRNFYMSPKQPNNVAGKTPNHFMTNYMARPDATESLTPFTDNHHAPFNQIKRLHSRLHLGMRTSINDYANYHGLDSHLLKIYGQDGRAFGNLGISYSTRTLYSQAKFFKHLYDSGHTLYKMVISFRDSYLRRMKVLPKNFIKRSRGDYFGHVDQLRLRQAITHGMDNLGLIGKFNHLSWSGAVQFDANHCHCHVIAGDDTPMSKSRRIVSHHPLMDRGIIPGREKRALRFGINHTLQELVPQPHYDAQTSLEHDKSVDYENLDVQNDASSSKLQNLIGSLPKNKSLWSFNNKSSLMRYPNYLIIKYLKYILGRYGKNLHYASVLRSLKRFAKLICYSKDLPMGDINAVYTHQVHKLHVSMAQNIYHSLKTSRIKLDDKTPYIAKISMDPDELSKHSSNTRLDLFLIHSRNYSHRLNQHNLQSKYYFLGYQRFNRYKRYGQIIPQSNRMKKYYLMELFYHMDVTDKYRYLLRFGYTNSAHYIHQFRPEAYRLAKSRHDLIQMHPFVRHGTNGFRLQQAAKYSLRILTLSRFAKVLPSRIKSKGADNGHTVNSVLNRISNHHLTYVPQDMQQKLNRVVPHSGSKLYQLSHPNISPVYYRRHVRRYTDELVNFYFKCFELGLVKSGQMKSVIRASENRKLPDLQKLSAPFEHLHSTDFDKVKCLDLDDTVDDFPSTSHPKVGNESMYAYSHSIIYQAQAIDDAHSFLNSTHQHSKQADANTRHLSYMSNFYRYLSDHNGQMPRDRSLTMNAEPDKAMLRNLKSPSSDSANMLTRKHLEMINDLDKQQDDQVSRVIHHNSSLSL